MDKVKLFPFDFNAMKKGDIVTVSELEHITGLRCGSKEFDLALLNLKGLVERQMELRDKPVIVRIMQGELHVLPDNAASDFNAREQEKHVRAVARCHRRFQRVDIANLSDDEKRKHEDRVVRSAMTVQALRSSRREAIKLTANKRNVPLLPGADAEDL